MQDCWFYRRNILCAQTRNLSVDEIMRQANVTEIFSVEYWCDLEMLVRDRPTSLKMAPVDFWSAIVGLTMAVSGTVFEIKRYIRQKANFRTPFLSCTIA